jgi:hypothetical protein
MWAERYHTPLWGVLERSKDTKNDWLSTCLWVGGSGSATQQNRKLRPLEWGQWSILRSSNSEPLMSLEGHFRQTNPLPTLSHVRFAPIRVRTFAPQRFDAVCHKVTYAVQQKSTLLDHLVGSYEGRWRDCSTNCSGSFKVEN